MNDYGDRVFEDYCQEITNCWIPKHQSFVTNIFRYPGADWIENHFNFGFPIAFWNNHLFIFSGHTSQNIWYSAIGDKITNIINDETGWQFVWDYIEEPVLKDISRSDTFFHCVGQQWVQYKNMIYMIYDRTRGGISAVDETLYPYTILIATGPAVTIDIYAIDLNMNAPTSNTKRYELPQSLPFNNSYEVCITTNGSHIFIVSHTIWIYNIYNNATNDTGHVLLDGLVGVGCAINNNHTKLYIFGGLIQNKKKINDKIFIYDVRNNELEILLNVLWTNPGYNVRAITAPNDNIYLYGGWSQYETEKHRIFDTKTNQFLNDKYSEQYNHEYFHQDYITPSAVLVEDNILLRMDSWIINEKYDKTLRMQLQYLITNRVSINFAALQKSILPSNDRSIQIFDSDDSPIYLFNEFIQSNVSKNYSFLFYSNSLNEETAKILIINGEYCLICNYNTTIIDKYYDDDECMNCKFGLNLPSSQLTDVGVYEIKMNINIIDNGGIDDLLLVTDELTFELIIPCLVDFSLLDNMEIVAGNKLKIKSNYQFKKCNNMKNDTISNFLFQSSELLINSNVTFTATICSKICDNNNGKCYDCLLHGLFPTLTTNSKKRIFDIKIRPLNDNALSIPSFITIKINDCESGTGIVSNSSIYECKRCQINQFKLSNGFSDCYTCIDKIDGAQCLGSNVIKLTYNYWMNGYNTKTNKYIDIEDMSNTNGDILYSHLCAPLYCCHDLDGCLYDKQSTNLCADNRLITSPLCSKCIYGTYELFGTTACGICNNYNFIWLWIMFILSMIFVFYIFFIDSVNVNLNPYKEMEINWKKLFIADEIKLIVIMVFKIMLYYYQSLAQIAALTGINHFLLPLVSIFDLSLDFNNSSSSSLGICVIPHLNALNEIIMSLIFILFILFHGIWISIAIKIYYKNKKKKNEKDIVGPLNDIVNSNKTKNNNNNNNNNNTNANNKGFKGATLQKVTGNNNNTNKNNEGFKGLEIMQRQSSKYYDLFSIVTARDPNILMGFIKIYVIIAGSVLKMSFKLLSCTILPNHDIVHLYDAEKKCLDIYWFIALFMVITIVLIYCYLFYFLYKQEKKRRENPKLNTLYKFISPFQHNLWFWEFTLFSRRLIIASFSSIQFMNREDIKSLLIALLVIYACYHSQNKPFISFRLNLMETICLFSLICILSKSNIGFDETSKFDNIFLWFSILLPFIIFFIYLIQMIIFIFYSFKTSRSFSESDLKIINKIQQRAPIPIKTATPSMNKIMQNEDDEIIDIMYDQYQNDHNKQIKTRQNIKHRIIIQETPQIPIESINITPTKLNVDVNNIDILFKATRYQQESITETDIEMEEICNEVMNNKSNTNTNNNKISLVSSGTDSEVP